MEPTQRDYESDPRARRGPAVVVGAIAAAGAAVSVLCCVPGLLDISMGWAVAFALLGAGELVSTLRALARPGRGRLLQAAGVAALAAAMWLSTGPRSDWLNPDPWLSASRVIGIVGHLTFLVNVTAAVLLAVAAVRVCRVAPSRTPRLIGWVAAAPLAVVVLLASVVGVVGSTDGLRFHRPDVALPSYLAAGRTSTVEFCRPGGYPLLMDLSTPPVAAKRPGPAPLALYVPGGGAMLGSRERTGLGASLANHAGALVGPLRQRLTAQGFVVAVIDYRHLPAAPWPAPLSDLRCAVRFLRAHAAGLDIDPSRIGVWGSSAGGTLTSLLALTPNVQGAGQWPGQSSRVEAVVDMFGPPDLVDTAGTPAFFRFELTAWGDRATRHRASPMTHVAPGAPPFLILQGTDDPVNSDNQSQRFAAALRGAGDDVTLTVVQGAGHGLDVPTEHPTPDQLSDEVAAFFDHHLG